MTNGFSHFFAKHPDIHVFDACKADVALDQMDGLLLTGGSDISPEFLRQEIPDPSVLDKQIDPERDRWNLRQCRKRSRVACRSWRLQRASGIQCGARRHAKARYLGPQLSAPKKKVRFSRCVMTRQLLIVSQK